MNLAGRVFRKLIPRPISYPLTCFKILEFDYGHFITTLKWTSIDDKGDPIPWYTYPAIEYIKQLDFSEKEVFEYGSGNSSLFWAKRARHITSIEHDSKWFEQISKSNLRNLDVKLLEDKDDYINSIDVHDNLDVIIIDGIYRKECAEKALTKLGKGGMIILDNSDKYINVPKVLRESGLIQIDMSGFGPINFYTWTTSLFVHRDFEFSYLQDTQFPSPSGSLKEHVN